VKVPPRLKELHGLCPGTEGWLRREEKPGLWLVTSEGLETSQVQERVSGSLHSKALSFNDVQIFCVGNSMEFAEENTPILKNLNHHQ
jgi:hypothetical protein